MKPKTLKDALINRLEEVKKLGWSKDIGAGFISSDIEAAYPTKRFSSISFRFNWPHAQLIRVEELNRRELEEVISFLDSKESEDRNA